MKLHLGCGPVYIPGFVHIDAVPHDHVDHVGAVDDLSHVLDNHVEMIYACHVLEHFGRHEYMSVLEEWFRVLEPGGKLRLSVPDFEKTVKVYTEKVHLTDGLRTLLGAVIGGQRSQYDYHKMIFDKETLEHDLIETGFENIQLWDWRATEHAHIDDFSQAHLPHMDKENGELMSLNIQANKKLS